MLAWASVVICLIGAAATVVLVLPEGYLPLRTAADSLWLLALVGPYAWLALLAWRRRADRRTSRALLFLIVFLTALGVYCFAAETRGYRAEVAARPDRPMKDLVQRVALFIVPPGQWLLTLVTAVAVFFSRPRVGRPA